MRQRWKESAVLLGGLFLSVGMIYSGLANWNRTPHLYEYDRDQIRAQEQNPELVQQGDSQEDNKREQQKPKNTKSQNNSNNDRKEEDEDQTNAQNTSDSDNQQFDPNGDVAVNGDGGTGDSTDPDINLPSGAPAGTPVPVDDAEPTAEPKVTATPAVSKPTPVPTQTDKVIAISCTWAERKDLLYGKDLPTDTIVVTAEYASGEKKQIPAGKYTIRGLNNDSLGEHSMKISYEGVECELRYVINNFTKEITYSWPTREQCYRGEELPGDALTVSTIMADGSRRQTTKFTLSGINSALIDEYQTFTISYKDTTIDETFKLTGTCRFLNRKITVHSYYYKDDALTQKVGEKTRNENYDYYAEEYLSLRDFQNGNLDDTDTVYQKKKYVLKEIAVSEVDDAGNLVKQSLPYFVKERFFNGVSLTKVYVLADE